MHDLSLAAEPGTSDHCYIMCITASLCDVYHVLHSGSTIVDLAPQLAVAPLGRSVWRPF